MASAALSHVQVQARAYEHRVQLTAHGNALCEQIAARVRQAGISEIARRSGIDRAALSRALKLRKMSFVTVAAVTEALGLTIHLSDDGHAL